KMMVSPKPMSPMPVISPSSVCVKPKSWPHTLRMSPRIAKPMPAAISVKKLAQNRIFSFDLPIESLRRKERTGISLGPKVGIVVSSSRRQVKCLSNEMSQCLLPWLRRSFWYRSGNEIGPLASHQEQELLADLCGMTLQLGQE